MLDGNVLAPDGGLRDDFSEQARSAGVGFVATKTVGHRALVQIERPGTRVALWASRACMKPGSTAGLG